MTTKVSPLMLTDATREGVDRVRMPATNGTYPYYLSAPFDFEIISAADQTDTGTIKWRIEINGTPVQFTTGDGSENQTASSTASTDTTDAASSVSAGDPVTLVLSGATSSPTLLALDIKIRRTS